jgi:hypothetical protein
VEEHELEFWTASAQMAAVFALAFVVEVRALFGSPHPDSAWLSWKLFATGFLIANAVTIGLGFWFSVEALYTGESSPGAMSYTRSSLTTAFILLVASPVTALLLRVWLYRVPQPAEASLTPRPAPESAEKSAARPGLLRRHLRRNRSKSTRRGRGGSESRN